MSDCNKYCSKKNKCKLKGANKEWRIKKNNGDKRI